MENPSNNPPVAPTTRQIAEASGCNQSSVSRALRGADGVSKVGRERILATAKKLGWKPNALASAYMAQVRTQRPPAFRATIAYLNTHPTSNSPSDWLNCKARQYYGAFQRASELGFLVESIWLNQPGMTARRLQSILRNRSITGLIVPKADGPRTVLDAMSWDKYVSVALEFSLDVPRVYRVATHSTHGFELMFRKAVEFGYKRIGVIVSHDYDRGIDHGVMFPMSYVQRFCGREIEVLHYDFAASVPGEIPLIQNWLRRERPDMVLGEEIAWASIQGMHWRVPDDVAFINVDRSPLYPHIAGYDHQHDVLGAATVDLMVGRLLQNDVGLPEVARCLMVQGCWADGPSAPRRKVRA